MSHHVEDKGVTEGVSTTKRTANSRQCLKGRRKSMDSNIGTGWVAWWSIECEEADMEIDTYKRPTRVEVRGPRGPRVTIQD